MAGEKAKVLRAELGARRVLVTGDIHGNLALFRELLEKMAYVPGKDALVVAGDLLQKGTENLAVLRYAMELSEFPNTYFLLGNNDLFVFYGRNERLLEIAEFLKERSVLWEMAQEGGYPFPATPEEMGKFRKWAGKTYPAEFGFLEGLPHILETEKFLFAHAGLENEDLEAQTRDTALSAPAFHDSVSHVFSKLLVVGHWPVANYRKDCLSNAPLFNASHNVLSMDGGNRVNLLGQLNGLLLDGGTGQWSWTYTDQFPKIPAPCSQEGVPGTVITWPDNQVQLLEKGEGISHYRFLGDGTEFDIPDLLIYDDLGDGIFRTEDITNALPAVRQGEEVSLVWQGGGKMLLMKNGEAGFLLQFPKKDV